MTAFGLRCDFCLDGYTPAGTLPVLGEIFLACLACRRRCRKCDGTAVFPAAHRNLDQFVLQLAGLGLAALLCPRCLGITALLSLDYFGGAR